MQFLLKLPRLGPRKNARHQLNLTRSTLFSVPFGTVPPRFRPNILPSVPKMQKSRLFSAKADFFLINISVNIMHSCQKVALRKALCSYRHGEGETAAIRRLLVTKALRLWLQDAFMCSKTIVSHPFKAPPHKGQRHLAAPAHAGAVRASGPLRQNKGHPEGCPLFWRRRRDSNSRAGFNPTYALSRGASSPT